MECNWEWRQARCDMALLLRSWKTRQAIDGVPPGRLDAAALLKGVVETAIQKKFKECKFQEVLVKDRLSGERVVSTLSQIWSNTQKYQGHKTNPVYAVEESSCVARLCESLSASD